MEFMKIIRSKRKTYEIRILPNGDLEVRVPKSATKAQVEQLLAHKAAWIEAKLALVQQRQAPPRRFQAGETFLYLGTAYPLLIQPSVKKPLQFQDGFILSEAALPTAAAVLEKWYRQQARRVLEERVSFWAARYGLSPAGVSINAARTRWGSCGARGTLNFTWRLVMAPLAVIDYVVVHELAHLKERNHSARFWEEVERMMPGYSQHRQWLKQHGHTLSLE
jgi:predicted metal-dependent hydrolase